MGDTIWFRILELTTLMDTKTAAILDAMEQAAISGLCREGQLEIGMQVARSLHPEMSEAELLAIAEAIYRRISGS